MSGQKRRVLDLNDRVLCNRRSRLSRTAANGLAAGDLDKINEFAIVPLEADDVIVRTAYLANDQIDDEATRLLATAIDKTATLVPGAALMRNHDGNLGNSEGLPVGRWFKCWTEKDAAGAYWDVGKYYMVREPMTESLARRADGGVISEVSLNWYTRVRDIRCSICEENPYDPRSRCEHAPGRKYGQRMCSLDQLDVLSVEEVSLVWKGGKTGTSIEMPDDARGALSMSRLASERRQQFAPSAPNADHLAAWWEEDRHAPMRAWFNQSAG